MSTLDIVLPALNAAVLTDRCVTVLNAFGVSGQRIILVDDGSTAEADALGEIGARVAFAGGRFLRHETNKGPHVAWNTGWRAGDAKVVLFINNDVVVSPWALRRLLADVLLASDIYVSARELQGPAPPASWPKEATGWATTDNSAAAGLCDPGALLVGPAHFNACFAVRRSLLEALDGFDESMFLTYSDTDFMERARDKGINFLVDKNAPVFHGVSVTRRKQIGAARDLALEEKDRAVFEAKWADRPDVLARHPGFTGDEGRKAREIFWAPGRIENVE